MVTSPVAPREDPMVASTTLDADIFLRLWSREKMTPALARHMLRMSFDENERARMHDLAARNQEGTITTDELAELDQFIRVGTVLSIIQSRARQLLKSKKSSKNRGY